MRIRSLAASVLALSLLAAACGDDDDDGSDTTTAETTDGADTTDGAETTDGADTTDGDESAAGCDPLPVFAEGELTVATGETVFPPWMGVGDDNFDVPESGTGFEGALVYELAEELGFTAEQVTFVRTGFDEVIAPGEKDWDFNIQQYSITEDRDEVVDFSDGYYQVEQAIIGRADGPAADATSIDDLKSLRIGASIGSTSLDYAEDVIDPDEQVQVYDDESAAKAAFDANQVDAIVFDLPTAYFVTATEITDAAVIGVLPRDDSTPAELGMLFEEGNPLVPCMNEALATLIDDGTIEALEDEWLNEGGDIPTLTN